MKIPTWLWVCGIFICGAIVYILRFGLSGETVDQLANATVAVVFIYLGYRTFAKKKDDTEEERQ